MTLEAFKRAALTKAGAWVSGIVIAFLMSAAAFGQRAFDMAVASTQTVKALEARVERVDAIERAVTNFIAASAEVNPKLGEALDRRRMAQDSAAAAEKRNRERYNYLGR